MRGKLSSEQGPMKMGKEERMEGDGMRGGRRGRKLGDTKKAR